MLGSTTTPAVAPPAVRPRPRALFGSPRTRVKKILVYGTIAFYLFIVLLPLYWMLRSSISENAEMYGTSVSFFPTKLTLAQFEQAINKWQFGLYLSNSIAVALVTTTLTTVMATLAAYSLVRLRYPGRAALARSILFVYLIPAGLLFIPLFMIMQRLGLLNSQLSLVISYQTFAIPFCTWMLIGYFKGIPAEMEEAALIDGATRLQAMRHVMIPMAAPGLVAAAVFTFTLAWNEFLYALVFITSNTYRTLPVGLAGLIRGDIYLWGPMMAGSVMAAIPVMVLYTVANRFLVQGLAAGAVKG
ncbi:MAG: carbohydrate ABC transporter permease [Chloroflexi bacterium]|nr:carbohydrate ABC transporter permease [Chloroflexota bacterium]